MLFVLGRRACAAGIGAVLLPLSLACNRVPIDPPETPSLDEFLPPPPTPDGSPQSVFAGRLSPDNLAAERIDGPAAQGLPGDIFLRNDKIRLVIQQPGRVMGLIPVGGTIVDADVVREAGDPKLDADNDAQDGVGNDHWGELSILFNLGRVVDVTRCDLVVDGSGGGAALVRCFGRDDINDFINLPGVFPVPLGPILDPDRQLGYEIAIDYLLEPGKDSVQVRYTVLNPSGEDVATPVGVLGDIGGVSEPFLPGAGFGGAGFEDLFSGGVIASPYAAVQSAGVAYGVIPFYLRPDTQEHDPEMTGLTVVISGGLAIAYDVKDIVGLTDDKNLDEHGFFTRARSASTVGFDFVVAGRDVAGVEARFQELRRGVTPAALSGRVTAGGAPLANARVGVFQSADAILDPTENPLTGFATDANGDYSGELAPGQYLLVADAEGIERGAPQPITLGAGALSGVDFALPPPARIAYSVTDATGAPFSTPARITIVGDDTNPPDRRFRDNKSSNHLAQPAGVVSTRFSRTGSSASDPEGAILVEPGRYRVFVSRGMEYSRHEQIVDLASGQQVTVNAALVRVVDTAGYIRGDFHQHAVNSPDAPVDIEDRAVTYAADGTEFFASTDHDFRTDYEPILNRLGLDTFVDSIVGEETTTFDYGHFNAFPLAVDDTLPNNGAIDWGRGRQFLNLLPKEIFTALRGAGARVIQINHPRSTSALTFQNFFDQAKLTFDFASRTFGSADDTANDVFRLPGGEPLFDDDFDAIELYNGFQVEDINGDGVREEVRVDLLLRDSFNFYSMGKLPTLVGTTDTHSTSDPVGAPNTYLRVPDDSVAAIAAGSIREGVLSSLTGRTATGQAAARDVVVSNAPFIRVEVGAQSAIGRVVASSGNSITLRIRAESPDWAEINTVEIFANQTFEALEPGAPFDPGPLTPNLCFTARQGLSANDTCAAATVGGAQPLTVSLVNRGGAQVFVVDFNVTVNLDQLPNRGDTGDTWIVVRVYGSGSLFPEVPGIANVTFADIVEQGSSAALGGVFPLAITNPVLVDRNGDGRFTAPFEP